MEKGAGALGAGVDALRHHEVDEASLAAGGDERAVFADGLLRGGKPRRGCGGVAGGVFCFFTDLVVVAAADAGAAVFVGGSVIVVVMVVVT